MSAIPMHRLLRLHVHGLQIDIERDEGRVVNLVARADQQHKGLWGRLRQHLAHALFRAGDLCHPGHHHRALRVIELHMPAAPIDDEATWFRHCYVAQCWPRHMANGETHHQTFAVYEGVESQQDRLTALQQFFRGGRQQRAEDAHAGSLIETPIVLKDRHV